MDDKTRVPSCGEALVFQRPFFFLKGLRRRG